QSGAQQRSHAVTLQRFPSKSCRPDLESTQQVGGGLLYCRQHFRLFEAVLEQLRQTADRQTSAARRSSVAMATEMASEAESGAGAGDSEELQRLCGEVGSNIELEVRRLRQQDFPLKSFANSAGPSRGLQADGKTVAHFAAMNRKSNSCLKWLVKELGSDCLTVPDKYGNTAVHLAAQHQSIESLDAGELVKSLGSDCLTVPDSRGDTAVHLAAQHQSIESLEWIKRQIGTDCFRLKGFDCLTVPDKYGDTAVHLAAQHQGIESLEWIKRQIGTDCFRLKGDYDSTAFHFAARKSDNSNLKHQGIESLVDHQETDSETDCFRLKGLWDRTAFHFAAEKSDNSNLKWLLKELGKPTVSQFLTDPFIFDQIGAEMFSLKNNRAKHRLMLLRVGGAKQTTSAKRAWISSTQRGSKPLGLPLAAQPPTAASAALGDELPSVSTEIHKAVESERNLCRLRHPNIVRFLHIAQPEPATVVVFMELLDGRSLERFIDKPLDDELTIRDFSEQSYSEQESRTACSTAESRTSGRSAASVFQMASGARPFRGNQSVYQVALKIANSGAPALPDGRSAELRDFYSRCTAKDRRQRKAARGVA
uniref:ANK_REP_REGION domain-containing protein n=1 Tax=Macrostomum lignano TaxID=282301 RepID=A0A1I8FEB6_9PLAT